MNEQSRNFSRRSHSSDDQRKRNSANPRYSGIKATVNSGDNTQKQMERLEQMRGLYKLRPDEIFRRINIVTLVNLMLEVAKLEIQISDQLRYQREHRNNSDEEEADSAIDNNEGDAADDLEEDEIEIFMQRVNNPNSGLESNLSIRRSFNNNQNQFRSSSVADLIQGIGELDQRFDSVSVAHDEIDEDLENRPYLLLDVRSPEEFESGHITTSLNYQASRLSRAMNFETRPMLRFKNKKGKIIVIYDSDESSAIRCATTLVQRGYDNVFMLSGGLKVAMMKFPAANLISKLPVSKFSEDDINGLENALFDTPDLMKLSSRMSHR